MSHSVELGERIFKGWHAWTVTRGDLEVVLVPRIGGRIMGLVWRGQELFFTQPEREGTVPVLGPDDVRAQKRAMGFPLWGGDKTWIAPQSAWNDGMPYLDLDSGGYALSVNVSGPERVTLMMTSRVCRETGLRVRRTVTLTADDPDIVIKHELENAGSAAVQCGVWSVTMVALPGVVYLPTSTDSAFPGGVRTYEWEGDSALARAEVVREEAAYAAVRCRDRRAFKFGADGPAGWIAAVLEGEGGRLVGYRKSMPAFPDRAYAHGCVVEVYQSDQYRYLEMELHGPLLTLQPGDRFAIDERQRVSDISEWPRTEADVLAIGEIS